MEGGVAAQIGFRPRRAQPGTHHLAQWLPAAALGHARRHHRAANLETRHGSYSPVLIEPRRRRERALLGVVQQAYVEGVSTRRVDDLVHSCGCEGISKSHVSRICAELDTVRHELTGC